MPIEVDVIVLCRCQVCLVYDGVAFGTQHPESSIAPVPDVVPPESTPSAAIAPILNSEENV